VDHEQPGEIADGGSTAMSEDESPRRTADSGPAELERGISPTLLLLFVVGDMVGGGIYALVGKVAAVTGGAVWSAFLLALVLALFTAFAYAELVTKYPRAGGAAFYVHRAFRSPFFSFIVAFAVVISGITSASALAIAFGGDYLAAFVDLPTIPVAIVFILVVAGINHRGITESVTINAVFTLIELTGLLLIVAIGVAAVGGGTGDPSRALQFKAGVEVPLAILAGAGLSFYALIGFEDSVNVAEETRNPGRSFPRALFGGIAIAGVIYLLVTVVASTVVPTTQLVESSGPLLEVVREGPLDVPPRLFALIALFALSNGALINAIMASRLVYGMSREGVMPAIFARVHPLRRTPTAAIVFTTLVAVCLIATGDVADLAGTTVLLLLTTFIVVNVSVLVLRRDPVEPEHFRTPVVFPILGTLVCAGLLTQQAAEVWGRAGALLVLGALLYGVNVLVKRRLDERERRAPA
jgi:basic amino acid/polyamine antiporter, APA family